MRDLDNERELTVKAILDLNDRIRIVESKFNERGEEDTWRLWMDLRKLLVLGDTANGGKKKEQKGCGKVFEMLQMLDEKMTKLINRFNRLASELGYKV